MGGDRRHEHRNETHEKMRVKLMRRTTGTTNTITANNSKLLIFTDHRLLHAHAREGERLFDLREAQLKSVCTGQRGEGGDSVTTRSCTRAPVFFNHQASQWHARCVRRVCLRLSASVCRYFTSCRARAFTLTVLEADLRTSASCSPKNVTGEQRLGPAGARSSLPDRRRRSSAGR